MPRQQGKPAHIGVVGASGRLGALIVETAASHGFAVTAIASSRRADWPAGTRHCPHGDPADWSALLPDLAQLDAVIIAAPLVSEQLHRLCLEAGCHVADVGISEGTIRACLTLDGLARAHNRSLVVMAGLAPGLSGLLGAHMARSHPLAKAIDVTLVQSASGTAGDQGTRDMLDMLTDRSRSPLTRVPDCGPAGQAGPLQQAFALPTAETVFLTSGPAMPTIRYHTLFDAPYLNRSIRVLRRLRSLATPLYRLIRNLAAAAKSKQVPPDDERIRLVGVATGPDVTVLGCNAYAYASDYGATAAAATALADLACSGALRAGAGHPARMTDWATLAGHDCLQRVARPDQVVAAV